MPVRLFCDFMDDPMDCTQPGSTVYGIFQAGILGLLCVCACAQSLSHVRLWTTAQSVTCQAPLSMEFSSQEYWSGLPFPPPWALPDPWIEPASPVVLALAGGFFTTEPPGKPQLLLNFMLITIGKRTLETEASCLVKLRKWKFSEASQYRSL